MPASFLDLIAKKRDGESLSEDDIAAFVKGITQRQMEEHQIGKDGHGCLYRKAESLRKVNI